MKNINYAFIFARGGSKGLPNKNIKALAGKPLIQYTLDTALALPSISKVFVSTDDMKISSIAEAAGAIIINRPKELATDNSPEWLSWQHAIDWVTDRYGKFNYFLSLPATSPLRSINDVESALKKCIEKEADICISVTPSNHSPYFNMVKRDNNDLVHIVNRPEHELFRRQDAPKIFDITTVVYASTPNYILNNNSIFSGKVTSISVPKDRAIDIDDIYDFRLAEIIINELKRS